MQRLRAVLAAVAVFGLVSACTESSSVRDSGSGSYGGPINQPMVRKRNDGNPDVSVPGGCQVLHDSTGSLITKGSSCSKDDAILANQAVAEYFRRQ